MFTTYLQSDLVCEEIHDLLKCRKEQSVDKRSVSYKRCLTCCKVAVQSCSQCQQVLYCSKKCKQIDYSVHLKECHAPSTPKSNSLFDLTLRDDDVKMNDLMFELETDAINTD
jgi:hypothetical protein